MTRALIVDDKFENLYLLRMLLRAHGFEVAEAADGAQALNDARSRAPDVVISDLLMPVMDGYTLLREWKSDPALTNIPFIVYTATYTDPKDEKLALDLGADAFIVKPAEPEPFMQRVQSVLAQAQAGALPPRAASVHGESALQRYSEVLTRKVEQKSAQLEQRVVELAASQDQVKRLNHLYAALSETNQAIVHHTDRDALFATVCRIAVERGGFALAWIGMLDAKSGEIVPAATGGSGEPWFASMRPFTINGPRRAPVEYAVGGQRIYLCNDLLSAPQHVAVRDTLLRSNLRSAASLPLRLNSQVVGALTLFASEANFFDTQLTELVTEMAADVSFALEIFERDRLRRKAEEELRRTNIELEARVQARTAELATANRELEAFAYTVSHDLRAPLRSIDGYSHILLDDFGGKLDDAARAHLQQINVNAARMGKLIDALLKLSTTGRQNMHVEHVDLSAMAQEILASLAHDMPARKLRTHVEPGCSANGDAPLLHALLQNLLENACKYSARQPQSLVQFGSAPTQFGRAFFVKDNGAGFDMRQADRLFQPFQRLHSMEEFEGTGIGLATAARIVARHGGRIWAESKVGHGSTFYFTLA